MPDPETITRLLWSHVRRPSAEVWAIVDGARKDGLAQAVRFSALDHCCLYSGRRGLELQDVAPYLVHLRKGWQFTRRLIEKGWGNSWGIFFTSDATLDSLRHHFRQFLRVRDEQGRRLIFRYYDPRVLRIYLPSCNAEELRLWFEQVDAYMMDGDDPEVMLSFRHDGGELKQSAVRIAETLA